VTISVAIIEENAERRQKIIDLLRGKAGLIPLPDINRLTDLLGSDKHESRKVDVAIVNLDQAEGLNLVFWLFESAVILPDTKILGLTRGENKTILGIALSIEVSGLYPIHIMEDEIISAVVAVANGDSAFHSTIDPQIRCMLDLFDKGNLKNGSHSTAGSQNYLSAIRHLTCREKDVFLHVIRGKSNLEIAKELSISVKTVEFHITNILRKLGLTSRVDLILFAIDQ
jgi:DNA-binding NarL/FixJ family response regulator